MSDSSKEQRRTLDEWYKLVTHVDCQVKLTSRLWNIFYRLHIYSIWVNKPNNSIEKLEKFLEKNMSPIYDSARRQGFELWNLGE